jgi:hypothetical protein
LVRPKYWHKTFRGVEVKSSRAEKEKTKMSNYIYQGQGGDSIYDTVYEGNGVVYQGAKYVEPALRNEVREYAAKYLNTEAMYMTPSEYVSNKASEYEPEDDGYEEDMDDMDDDDNDILAAAVQDLRLAGMYQREAADPTHRMGNLLAAAFEIYEKLRESDTAKSGNAIVDSMIGELRINARRMSLYDWLDSIPEYKRVVMISHHPLMRLGRHADSNLSPSMVVAFVRGVAYLDAEARKKYALDIRGSIWQRRKLLSTESMRTVHSGIGYAIWVAGGNPTTFYAGNHVKGQFHHSSFLSGGNVVCGGEMVVHNGKLKLLTGKTGHYQAGTSNFVNAIRLLQGMGVDPNSYRVLVWSKTDYSNKPILPCPKAAEVLNSPNFYDTWNTAFRGRINTTDWNI